ncbi:MAG: SIMPL domain-containing protein [Patescibacteria group bacterium]
MENFSPSSSSAPESRIHISVPIYIPIIIGASLVIAAALGSYTFYAVRSLDNVLSVTGSAKTHVTADTVKWRISVTRKVSEFALQSGYPILAKDVKDVQTFLKANAVADDAVTVSPVFVEEMYNYNSNNGSAPRQFNLREEITVTSKDVHAIDALSKNINSELADKGIFISNNWLEFYVSNLADLRVSLLADAVKDAKARATEIAKAGGTKVGALKSASSGVVQVLAPNSIEVTDYGTYDTQSLEKDVMVTARATFFVQ